MEHEACSRLHVSRALTHYQVGKKVRQTIQELGGSMPEDLPAAESIKKIESKKRKQIGESE